MVVALGNSTQISRNKRKNVVGEIETENQLVIKLPEGRILRVIARSVLLCVAILAFPWIGSLLRSPAALNDDMVTTWRQPINEFFFLPVLFQDLNHHDLLKIGDRALFLGGVQEARPLLESEGTEMDLTLISPSDEQKQGSVPDETFDFAYAVGFGAAGFIDRALKTNGVAAIRLTGDPAETFRVPTNFRIVYIRKFHNTIVAFRKIAPSGDPNPTRQSSRKLLDAAKKAALDGLEDPLLEPPRSRSKETQRQYQRIKYLPQLTGDSLDGYPRRVFISVGPNLNSDGWLERNYPSKNRDFEIYKVETVGDKGWAPPVGMSEWLERNVREEEYVVMQAEAEVVEEMMKSRAINLVDELFLECKHEGQKGSRKMKSRRAYWECLALFGKLRDEGVAVHQWWG